MPSPAPSYVPGHGLLTDKVVVVTAAAGAGIGASAVRRSLEEGARVVVLSDTHERRHHRLAIAATLLEIGIAISTIAIITRSRWPWIGAAGLGAVGAAVVALAYLT